MTDNLEKLWTQFCENKDVLANSVLLFETDQNGQVMTRTIGVTNKREVLSRSKQMEDLIRKEVSVLISDYKNKNHQYDGLIYMMFTKEGSKVIPLYIGKTETLGKLGGNLSANIKGLETDTSKFARWGDNYAYHIGDLSAVVLPDHDPRYKTPKYESWAKTLFESYPTNKPKLKKLVYFWTKSWSSSETGIWEDFGFTRLTFLEYLLIGVASSLFKDTLLNREGINH